MGQQKEKKRIITIDEKEFVFNDLDPTQQFLVNQLADLDNKLAEMKWKWDQYSGGREYFMAQVRGSLNLPTPPVAVEGEPIT